MDYVNIWNSFQIFSIPWQNSPFLIDKGSLIIFWLNSPCQSEKAKQMKTSPRCALHKSPYSCQQLLLVQNAMLSRHGVVLIIRIHLGEGWILLGQLSIVPSKTIEEKCACLLRKSYFITNSGKHTRCRTHFLFPGSNVLIIRHIVAGFPSPQLYRFPQKF